MIAVLTTVLLLLCGATGASACNEPSLALGKTNAAPGENVPYSIANADEGAQFTLSVAGRQVASGTAGPDFSSSFTMPDLGSSQTAHAELVVSHEGTQWFSSKALAFEAPPAQPQPSAPPDSTGADRSQAPAAPGAVAGPKAPSAGGPVAPPSRSPAGQPERTRLSDDAAQGAHPPHRSAPARASEPRADAVVASPTAAEASAAVKTQRAGRRGAAAASRGATVRPPVPARQAVPVHAWGSTAPGAHGGLTPSVALALGLLFLAGLAGGGFGFARVRTRRPAPWVPPSVAAEVRARDLLIEAELQEIITEYRLPETLGEPEPEPFREAEPARELVGRPGG
jgi:hypothetical protein